MSPASPATSPAPRDAWWDVFQADPYALETQSPAWTDAMCDGGAYEDVSRCYEVGGRGTILPMLRRRVAGLVALDAANPPPRGAGGLPAPRGPTVAGPATALRGLATR